MRKRPLVAAWGAMVVAVPLLIATPVAAEETTDPYRPEIHFSPAENWINDPNGPVWYRGEYHLYFQYNPEGDRWGNMSWGHAVSKDLVHWEERPVAIPYSEREHIFSGSVVVDERNTSGLGLPGNPAMVALYTSWDPVTGSQAQSVAYSTDGGETWTKYEGNPVLDLNSTDFRDPKVFWYDEGGYWVMAVVLATEHKVQFYRSDDLLQWEHLSDFGPANAVGGVWEMPDLFELPVDGDPNNTRWVLVVNLNPGSIAGGSGAQYFIGDFDGTTFTAENLVTDDELPAGEVLWGFDGGTYEGWSVGNEPGNWLNGPWGEAPAAGTLPGQNTVSGFVGSGLVNGFLDGDWPVGTLESPVFTVEDDYLNLLVGGGRHPHVDGSQLGNEPPAGRTVFDFELPDGTTLADSGWDVTGDFATEPWRNPSTAGGDYYLGAKRLNTWEGGPSGDANIGTMTSTPFLLDGDYVSFLIGGGSRTDGTLQAELLVDGEVVRTQTGPQAGALMWRSWDVSELRGETAQLRLVDRATGGWGHLTFDHLVVGDERAQVRSDETSVNLIVDGEVVRSATGADSESLDWTSWNVSQYVGQEATLRIVDNNRFGWGHILVDQIMASDAPAPTWLERYDWVDYGKDFYAALSFENVPGDKRIAIAWMNNWQYAEVTPTGSWRGSMSLPRELSLQTVDGEIQLTQEFVKSVSSVTRGAPYKLRNQTIGEGVTPLPDAADGTVLAITAEFEVGTADEFGLHVRAGDGERTVVGYDVAAEEVFVDRTQSGQVDFHPAFPGVHAAPLTAEDGVVRMTVYVDRSSVEVLGGDGVAAITDLIYPDLSSDGVAVYAEGGEVLVRSLTVRQLEAQD